MPGLSSSEPCAAFVPEREPPVCGIRASLLALRRQAGSVRVGRIPCRGSHTPSWPCRRPRVHAGARAIWIIDCSRILAALDWSRILAALVRLDAVAPVVEEDRAGPWQQRLTSPGGTSGTVRGDDDHRLAHADAVAAKRTQDESVPLHRENCAHVPNLSASVVRRASGGGDYARRSRGSAAAGDSTLPGESLIQAAERRAGSPHLRAEDVAASLGCSRRTVHERPRLVASALPSGMRDLRLLASHHRARGAPGQVAGAAAERARARSPSSEPVCPTALTSTRTLCPVTR